MKLNIRKEGTGSAARFVLDFKPIGGKRQRPRFKTRAEAESLADEKKLAARKVGESYLALSPAQRLDLMAAYTRLEKHNITLSEVIDQWEAGKGRSNGNGPAIKTVSLAEAGEAWEGFMRAKGNSVMHCENAGRWVRKFARGRESMPVNKVTDAHVREYLGKYDGVSYNSNRDSARGFFGFCWRQKYHADLICSSDVIPKRKIRGRIPVHLTPEQLEKMMAYCVRNPELLAYVTLATFCGIRPTEIDRLVWSDVDFEQGIVDVRIAKTDAPRQVHLHPTAKAWLVLALSLDSPIGLFFAPSPAVKQKKMLPLRDHMGWKAWPADILRKSFGSYYCELVGDEGKTATEMGNTAAIVKKHYKAVVKPAACEKFWAVTPATVQAKKSL